MIETAIVIIVTFLIGFFLGDRGRKVNEELEVKVKKLTQDRPKPGVVNHLTEEQIKEKHDPIKRGNLASFDELGQKMGWKK